MATMTITDPSWTIDGTDAAWKAQDFGEIPAKAATNFQIDWIRKTVAERLPGWHFDPISGQFSGPARPDALDAVTALVAESIARITDPE